MKLSADRIRRAKTIIRSQAKGHVCVAFSGGKDALAVLALAEEALGRALPLVIAFTTPLVKEDRILYEAGQDGRCVVLGLLRSNADLPLPENVSPDQARKFFAPSYSAVYAAETDSSTHYRIDVEYARLAYLAGFDVCLTGLKTTDDLGRYMFQADELNILARGKVEVVDRSRGQELPLKLVAPIWDWSDEDVFLFLADRGLLDEGWVSRLFENYLR